MPPLMCLRKTRIELFMRRREYYIYESSFFLYVRFIFFVKIVMCAMGACIQSQTEPNIDYLGNFYTF